MAEAEIEALVEMGGWPREDCNAALQLGGGLEAAAELLLGGFPGAAPIGFPPAPGPDPLPPMPPDPAPREGSGEGADGEGEPGSPSADDLFRTLQERPEYAEAAAAAFEALSACPAERLRALGLSQEHIALLTVLGAPPAPPHLVARNLISWS